MKCNWTTKKLSEIAYVNPRESLGKGIVAKKVPMDKLQPFCRDIPEFVLEEYKGGTKFRNGDTIMARITPCLENGKIADFQKVHPHKFRRTLATVAIDKGMPIEQLQQLLGHRKIDTTLQYAMVKQSNVKIAHRKYIG